MPCSSFMTVWKAWTAQAILTCAWPGDLELATGMPFGVVCLPACARNMGFVLLRHWQQKPTSHPEQHKAANVLDCLWPLACMGSESLTPSVVSPRVSCQSMQRGARTQPAYANESAKGMCHAGGPPQDRMMSSCPFWGPLAAWMALSVTCRRVWPPSMAPDSRVQDAWLHVRECSAVHAAPSVSHSGQTGAHTDAQ